MNLLFCINKNFIPLLSSCVRSILQNGGQNQYDAYILHSDLEEDDFNKLEAELGEGVRFHCVTVDPDIFEGFPETKRYPAQIYYRLAAPLLLPEDLDRILYLDVDTVIINPLNELYQMSFDGNWFLACTHANRLLTDVNKVRLGIQKDVPYVNTGVMLYNLTELRNNLRLEDIREYAERRMQTFILPDQDILTALYGDKVKLIDTMRYNLSDRLLAIHNADPRNEKLDLEWVRKNCVVIHYYGRNKPWKPNYNGILDVFYQELCR